MQNSLSQQEAAAELLRRRRARRSLVDFSQAIEIPGAPMSDDPDEWLFKPIESMVAAHHRLILDVAQQTIEQDYGRTMIFAPPGSAKSTYASVVSPAWFLGSVPGARCILGSYATGIARKQGRRMRQLCRSPLYQPIFSTTVSKESAAADEWALTNGSEFMAAGLMAGITGNRADLGVIDDPVAGREEADSETMRAKTWDAYNEDFLTRLKPKGSVFLIQTRWHEDDLAGRILPEGWNGESGLIECRDGQMWRVICLPAVAERTDDPLGRKPGELLWPEWFSQRHFATAKRLPRTWASLYQQRPAPAEGIQFKREWFKTYDTPPADLNIYGASDYAVTEGGGDYTVHGVFGIDAEGNVYVLAWWRKQAGTTESLRKFVDLLQKWRPRVWLGETGTIERAIAAERQRHMRDRSTFVHVDLLSSSQNKEAKAAGFAARAEYGAVYLPRNAPWVTDLLNELCTFPAGTHDDQVDVCGLIGRAMDVMSARQTRDEARKQGVTPFTWQWLTANDQEKPRVRID